MEAFFEVLVDFRVLLRKLCHLLEVYMHTHQVQSMPRSCKEGQYFIEALRMKVPDSQLPKRSAFMNFQSISTMGGGSVA